MKVSGSHHLHAPRERVRDTLADPEVLARAIPGCLRLQQVAPGTYDLRVHAAVAAVSGTYDGRVELTGHDAPDAYALRVAGSGEPGTIDATATVRLQDRGDGTTTVEYAAEAVVGGAVGGVGQRVLAGTARRNADAFFAALDRQLDEAGGVVEPAAPSSPAGTGPDPADAPAAAAEPPDAGPVQPGDGVITFTPGTARWAGMPLPVALLVAALLGAAIALLGVLVGRRGAA